MFTLCNIDIPSRGTFFTEQKRQIPIIKECTNKTVIQCRNNAAKNLNLSTDGCWDHVRNGTHCTVSAIDRDQDKVLYFSNITKDGGKRTGNFSQSSNMMESRGINDIINQIHNDNDRTINSLTHDNDNKTNTILKNDEKFKNAKIMLDPRHAISSIKKSINKTIEESNIMMNNRQNNSNNNNFKNFNESTQKKKKKKRKRNKNFFKGVAEKVVAWYIILITCIKDIPQRIAQWKNTPNHLIGDHTNCKHPQRDKRIEEELKNTEKPKKRGRGRPRNITSKDFVWNEGKQYPELKKRMQDFCDANLEYITDVDVDAGRTQSNESLNNMISSYASKRISWGDSYEARACIAIGMKNSPLTYEMSVMNAVGAPHLSPVLDSKFQIDNQRKFAQNDKKKTEEERKKKKIQRDKERKSYSTKKTVTMVIINKKLIY